MKKFTRSKLRANVIITMAGEGKRFKEVGVSLPKHIIKAKGRTLFEWSMLSLRNFYDNHFIFITKRSHNALPFITQKSKTLGIKNISIEELGGLTSGQAETALKAEKVIDNSKDPIIIYNIDTYVYPEQLRPEKIRGDGWVPSFEVEGDRWSFVDVDEDFRIVDIAEKVRISNYGTVGLYYFKSFDLYRNLYFRHPFKNTEERYIAPMYRLMIKDRALQVYTQILDKDAVHVLGTPEDIKQFDSAWIDHNAKTEEDHE